VNLWVGVKKKVTHWSPVRVNETTCGGRALV
jgi:hypothetical protein